MANTVQGKARHVIARANGPGNVRKQFVQACRAATNLLSGRTCREPRFVPALQAWKDFGL